MGSCQFVTVSQDSGDLKVMNRRVWLGRSSVSKDTYLERPHAWIVFFSCNLVRRTCYNEHHFLNGPGALTQRSGSPLRKQYVFSNHEGTNGNAVTMRGISTPPL